MDKTNKTNEKELKENNSNNNTAEEMENDFKGDEKRDNARRKDERRKRNRRENGAIYLSKGEKNLKNTISEKNEEIIKLTKDIETLKDIMMRRQADFENYKKRTSKSHEDFKKFAIKDFALDIIHINDDLLRAIEASESSMNDQSFEESHRSFVEGVTMVSNRIEETLGKYGIQEIDSIDQEFDPNFHEAVEIEMSPDVNHDMVTKVYQKGFSLEEVVLRSSKVKVTKPLKDNNEKAEEEVSITGNHSMNDDSNDAENLEK